MRILFISDLHGKVANLKILKSQLNLDHFDKVVVLGDLYTTSPFLDVGKIPLNDQIEDFLSQYQDKLLCLRGNCDTDLDVQRSALSFFEGMYHLKVANLDLYLTHGQDASFEGRHQLSFQKGILIYGHFHIPYIKKLDDRIYICVGSLSLPRGGSPASYLIYENNTFTLYTIGGQKLQQYTIMEKEIRKND